MLADAYKDEMERGHAIGIAFSGLALGVIGVCEATAPPVSLDLCTLCTLSFFFFLHNSFTGFDFS